MHFDLSETMNPKSLPTRGQAAIIASLSRYHPIVIEGMGAYDPREPNTVAETILKNCQVHWQTRVPSEKPKLLITQGDPLKDRGISAITPHVAAGLGIARGLVCLDEDVAEYHSENADRSNVIMEFRYSDFVQILDDSQPGIIRKLEDRIDQLLAQKNDRRKELGKSPLKDYFRDFALLQEVTKAASRLICGEITVGHTQAHISEFSVTSFFEAGIGCGLVEEEDVVHYGVEESFDFDTIDKR